MRIGIDISQIVFEGTGVGRYIREMVRALVLADANNEYILFGASLRRRRQLYEFYYQLKPNRQKVTLVVVPIPPTLLDIFWNQLHIFPIEWFIGKVDVFWSSDWTQPPLTGARGVTTIHDVSFLHYPEQFDKKIRDVHTRRLYWAAKECVSFFCDSRATKDDVIRLLGLEKESVHVIYPGFTKNDFVHV